MTSLPDKTHINVTIAHIFQQYTKNSRGCFAETSIHNITSFTMLYLSSYYDVTSAIVMITLESPMPRHVILRGSPSDLEIKGWPQEPIPLLSALGGHSDRSSWILLLV